LKHYEDNFLDVLNEGSYRQNFLNAMIIEIEKGNMVEDIIKTQREKMKWELIDKALDERNKEAFEKLINL
jgi:uncharacterized protein YpiB (UPF0302 family)